MTNTPERAAPEPTDPETSSGPGKNPDAGTEPKPGVNDPHPDEADTDEPLTSM